MKKSDVQALIREELQNHQITESVTGWLLDKVANGLKWATNKKADYQYDALLNSKDFRNLASKFNMSEKDFISKAKSLIQKDPQRFAKILAYDYKKDSIASKGYKF